MSLRQTNLGVYVPSKTQRRIDSPASFVCERLVRTNQSDNERRQYEQQYGAIATATVDVREDLIGHYLFQYLLLLVLPLAGIAAGIYAAVIGYAI